MSHVIIFIASFVVVCLMGLFCALAGGVVWGTGDAGAAAFLTFLFATVASTGVVAFLRK